MLPLLIPALYGHKLYDPGALSLLMKVPYEGLTHLRERVGKSRTALLEKRTASRVKTSRKFVSKLRHDLAPNTFPFGLPTLGNKYII